jgi:AraC-like DNA-binding protein
LAVKEANITAADEQTHVYIWERVLIIQARSRSINPAGRPIRRLSVTLKVANRNPLKLRYKGMPAREFQGVLMAPRALREPFDARESDYTIVDIDVAHPAYLAIEPRLRSDPVQALADDEIRALQALLRPGFLQPKSCAEIRTLFDRIVAVLTQAVPRDAAVRDARIVKTLELIDQLPLNELSLPLLAAHSCISESRLRHLFSQQMSCTLSQYMRWVGVHKAMALWKRDEPRIKGIEQAGFYDAAHFHHAFQRHYSMTPSVMGEVSKDWVIIKCAGAAGSKRTIP